MNRYCSKCGSSLIEESKFCSNCGFNFSNTNIDQNEDNKILKDSLIPMFENDLQSLLNELTDDNINIESINKIYGKCNLENGDVYEGDWVNGEYNGKGKYISKDGDIYEGEWDNNERTGMGKTTLKNGIILEGEFNEGEFINGKKYFPNGNIMEGDFHNGASINGKGKWIHSNQDIYEGNFINNSPVGDFILTKPNGEKIKGQFDSAFNFILYKSEGYSPIPPKDSAGIR